MGEEFLRTGEYRKCNLLMEHVLREFGNEKWGKLLLHVAQVGLKAAIALPDIPAYLSFIVILLKMDLRELLGHDEAKKLAYNLEAVLEKKVPKHESKC